MTTNRLAAARSLYLLEHQHQPVDWWPWCDDAFAEARRRGVPVFLSIGYSACHWCHVMARESFDSPAVAALLNEHFVSIKVDREERPDVDNVYMTATQALTGHGGWPMSVFLEPEQKRPFFAGTYFPKSDGDRGVRLGFTTVLSRLAAAWQQQRAQLVGSAEAIARELAAHHQSPAPKDVANVASVVDDAVAHAARAFDDKYGGTAGAPKFPSALPLSLLLDVGALGHERARTMGLKTLKQMAAGGIFDHVGGGFHRYSTDERWHVPHFEKMLVDNAQWAALLVGAWQVSADDNFQAAARATLSFIDATLSSDGGDGAGDGFAAATDADSVVDAATNARAEGRFFTFTRDEVVAALVGDSSGRSHVVPLVEKPHPQPLMQHGEGGVETVVHASASSQLTPVDAIGDAAADVTSRESTRDSGGVDVDVVCAAFGVTAAGNWEHGQNVLWRPETSHALAARLQVSVDVIDDAIARARPLLARARARRAAPARDPKIVAAYNGLAISAFAWAGFAFGDDALIARARRAFAFVDTHLRVDRSAASWRLHRTYAQGRAGIAGVVDDHALVCRAAVDLYCVTGDVAYLDAARALDDVLAAHFADDAHGSFFFCADDAEPMLYREKVDRCGAEPAGASVHAHTLARLAAITGDDTLRARAVRAVAASGQLLARAPHTAPELVRALLVLERAQELVVVVPDAAPADALLTLVRKRPLPGGVLVVVRDGAGDDPRAPALVRGRRAEHGATTAYLCHRGTCALPTTEPRALLAALTPHPGAAR